MRERFVALVGKGGPAFGDRPSFVTMEWVTGECESSFTHTANWPRDERTDALRALFDMAGQTIDPDGPWDESIIPVAPYPDAPYSEP